jgi:uncharacterized protein
VTGHSNDASPAPPASLSAEAVANYLRGHPTFLVDNPSLLSVLTPPEFAAGDRVVDMQRFMVERLRGENAALKIREQSLLAAAESNAVGHIKVQHAALTVLAACNLEHFIEIVTREMPPILDVEAIALCVESRLALAGSSCAGVMAIEPGTADSLLGDGADVALQSRCAGDERLFGRAAGRVRSVALVRLVFGGTAPNGLLALGSGDEDGFAPGQATDLLGFLARILEHGVRRWFDLPV